MASEFMISNDLRDNKINPTSWTGDFGVNSNGFPKSLRVDGKTVVSAIDETPMEDQAELRVRPIGDAGNVYLKTISASAPNGIFTARKLEYSDGRVTWYRPGLQPKKTEGIFPVNIKDQDNLFIILAIVSLGVLFLLRNK